MLFLLNSAGNISGQSFSIQFINVITFTIFSAVLSRMIYYSHAKDFQNRKLILRQKKELLDLSIRDPLTGALNRRSFSQIASTEAERIVRYGGCLSLILFDLDHFKKVNDQYGHAVGDVVLIQTSQLIRKNIRKSDNLFRWGGEEFVVLSPETNMEEMLLLAEKLRDLIEMHRYEGGLFVTASFGVAEHIKGESIEVAIQKADEALYFAKRSGRNLVRKHAL